MNTQENDSFKADHSIELSDEQGIDYTKDYIWGSDQSQYLEQEERQEPDNNAETSLE